MVQSLAASAVRRDPGPRGKGPWPPPPVPPWKVYRPCWYPYGRTRLHPPPTGPSFGWPVEWVEPRREGSNPVHRRRWSRPAWDRGRPSRRRRAHSSRAAWPRPGTTAIVASCHDLLDGVGRLVHDADGPADVRLVLFQRVHAKRQANGREEVRDGD